MQSIANTKSTTKTKRKQQIQPMTCHQNSTTLHPASRTILMACHGAGVRDCDAASSKATASVGRMVQTPGFHPTTSYRHHPRVI
jgi:hypothetical protein